MQKNIIATEPNVLKLFEMKNGRFEFWENTNMPKIIKGEHYFAQKIKYIHANPVRKQYVKNPEDWVWSSANIEGKIDIDTVV